MLFNLGGEGNVLVQSGVVCLVDVLEAVDLISVVSPVWYN